MRQSWRWFGWRLTSNTPAWCPRCTTRGPQPTFRTPRPFRRRDGRATRRPSVNGGSSMDGGVAKQSERRLPSRVMLAGDGRWEKRGTKQTAQDLIQMPILTTSRCFEPSGGLRNNLRLCLVLRPCCGPLQPSGWASGTRGSLTQPLHDLVARGGGGQERAAPRTHHGWRPRD